MVLDFFSGKGLGGLWKGRNPIQRNVFAAVLKTKNKMDLTLYFCFRTRSKKTKQQKKKQWEMNQQKNRWIDWAGIYRPGGILGLMKSLLFYYVTDKVELEFGHNKIITMDDNNKERERERRNEGDTRLEGKQQQFPQKKKFGGGAEEKKRNGESM